MVLSILLCSCVAITPLLKSTSQCRNGMVHKGTVRELLPMKQYEVSTDDNTIHKTVPFYSLSLRPPMGPNAPPYAPESSTIPA